MWPILLRTCFSFIVINSFRDLNFRDRAFTSKLRILARLVSWRSQRYLLSSHLLNMTMEYFKVVRLLRKKKHNLLEVKVSFLPSLSRQPSMFARKAFVILPGRYQTDRNMESCCSFCAECHETVGKENLSAICAQNQWKSLLGMF